MSVKGVISGEVVPLRRLYSLTNIPPLFVTLAIVILLAILCGMDIKTARKARRWTQDRLAQELGVSRSAVAQWEMRQGTMPAPKHALRMAELLAPLTLTDIYGSRAANCADVQGRAAA